MVPSLGYSRTEISRFVVTSMKSGGKIYHPGGAAEVLGTKPTSFASQIKKMEIMKAE